MQLKTIKSRDKIYKFNFRPRDHRLGPPQEEFSQDDPEDEQELRAGYYRQDEEYR